MESMDLGNYRLIERIGAGGMGEVWRAEDTKLLRHVAIKILPPSLALDAEWKDRFIREARAVAQLNHPNIATIYGIDEYQQSFYIAMELVEGEPLSNLIAEGPLSAADAVRVAAHIADGLQEAHEKGLVHRDIKPDNILVSKKVVKILDFGIAKQIGGTADPSLTQAGMVMGTPHYMSPEQALGRAVDARTDIFSVGVVLYEMLTGQKPFTGDAATQVLLQIVMNDPRDIAQAAPRTSRALAMIVRRCMQKQADERYQTCEELKKALADSLRTEPSRARLSQVPTLSQQKAVSIPPLPPSPGFRPAAPPPALGRPTTPAPPLVPTTAPPPAPPSTTSKERRALVADDDPSARYLLANVLQRHHIACDEAANGADAVKLLKANRYAFVFIDLLMPRIDGWGVLDFLRSHRPEPMPRTIVITGVKNQKLSSADQDLVTGLLYKPIDIAQIERLVTA
jgi:serine/threonine-protein kinase